MKESLTQAYVAPIFFDGLWSEFDTRRIGGTPTGVTYFNGQGTFSTAATSNIVYPTVVGIKTIRIKLISLVSMKCAIASPSGD